MKTITSNYTIKSDDKKLILDSSLESFILTLPESIGLGFEVEMICVGGTESVNSITIESTKETIMINGDSAFVIDTDRAVVNLALQNIFGKVVHLSCTQGAAGGGDYAGWAFNEVTNTSDLGSGVGMTVGTPDIDGLGKNYLSIIDTTAGDVSIDISELSVEGLVKNFKVHGPNKLILFDDDGFYTNDYPNNPQYLDVYDSCILICFNSRWEVIYNSEWKTAVIDISSAQLLDLTTPIELLPAAGVGKYYECTARFKSIFGTTPYDPDSMTKIEIKQGNQAILFPANVISPSYNNIAFGFSPTGSTTANQNVTLSADAIALDGDGTAQVILQYKVNTF